MTTLRCPQCSGNIELDENREYGFCPYCGMRIQLNETILHKHEGKIIVDGFPTANSLAQKGFLEIERGNFGAAFNTFNKAEEIDSDNTYVIVGKMLTDNACFYYKRLFSISPKITKEELEIIDEINSKYFFKIYVIFGDKDRVDYILKKYSNAVDIKLLFNDSVIPLYGAPIIKEGSSYWCRSKMLDENNPINIVQILLDNGYSSEQIFDSLFSKARHSNRLYIELFPLHILKELCKNGLSLKRSIEYDFDEHKETEWFYIYYGKKDKLQKNLKSNIYNEEKILEYNSFLCQYLPPNENKQKNKNGCYVATVIYGSYDCPEVWMLRRYRDNIIAKTWSGRVFIRSYYTISPTIVKLFGHTTLFRKICKSKLDKIVEALREKGVEDTPYNDKNW